MGISNPALAALHNCPVPTVARVNGVAAGGGMGLACMRRHHRSEVIVLRSDLDLVLE